MQRRRTLFAFGATLVPLIIFVYSASPSPAFWDTGEMATVPYLFGIAHPTCFPAFVFAGWLATHLIPFGTIAWRTALVAAAGTAAAACAAWLALDALELSPAAAMCWSWAFAFGNIVWIRATRAEVHALVLGFEALAIACAIVFAKRGGTRWAIASAACIGFALATHPNALWVLPGAIVILALAGRRWSPKDIALFVVAAVAPLLLYLYIPIRSAWLAQHRVDPTLALGVPPGQPFWNYGDPSTFTNFVWMVTGRQWNTGPAFASTLSPLHYVQALHFFVPITLGEHGWLLLVLAVAGLVALAFRSPAIAIGLAVTLLTIVAFVSAYTIEADKPRYLLTALWIEVVLSGALLAALERARVPRLAVTIFAFVVACSTLWVNRGDIRARTDPGAWPYIDRVKSLTGPNDVVIAQWTYVTPLGYARYAENAFGGRIPVNAGPPESIWLIQALATKYPTDLILEKPVPIPGFTLVPLDHGFPSVFRVVKNH